MLELDLLYHIVPCDTIIIKQQITVPASSAKSIEYFVLNIGLYFLISQDRMTSVTNNLKPLVS